MNYDPITVILEDDGDDDDEEDGIWAWKTS